MTAEPEVNIGSSRRGPIMTLRNSFQRTAREWNHLPDTRVGASSIEEFRANLQQQVSHANQCK
jgi:hypothetical protein